MPKLPPLTSDPKPLSARSMSVAGQRTLPNRERTWSMVLRKPPNIDLTMTTYCPCGYSWKVSQEKQLDAFVPCPKCGARM